MLSYRRKMPLAARVAAGVVVLLGLCPEHGALSARAADRGLAVTAVRFWSLGDVTRVAVETTGDFLARPERLSNPPRVFFDIPARQQISKEKIHTISVNDGLIKQIRIAQNKAATTRIVFDLEAHVEVTCSQLSSPDRLIVEARSTVPKSSSGASAAKAQLSSPARQADKPDKSPSTAPKAVSGKEPRAVASVRPARTPQTGLEAEPKTSAASAGEPRVTALAKTEISELEAAPAAEEAEADEMIGTPAQRTRGGDTSLTRVLGLKMGRIVIDPGHGGRDTGTIGTGGVMEKEIVLDVAQRLAKLIEERLGSEVFLTREDDSTVPLEARTAFANEKRADLFLSIHVNSSRYQAVSGVETFYLNFTRSRADLEVAARENAGSSQSIHELSELVQKIALDDKIQESRDLASHVQLAVHRSASKQNPRARNRGVKKAPFVVLIGAQMPSVLVEIGFLTNPAEQKLLKNPNHRQRIAEAIATGLADYASTLSHFKLAKTNGDD